MLNSMYQIIVYIYTYVWAEMEDILANFWSFCLSRSFHVWTAHVVLHLYYSVVSVTNDILSFKK